MAQIIFRTFGAIADNQIERKAVCSGAVHFHSIARALVPVCIVFNPRTVQ